MTLAAGLRVGPYEVLCPLGAGGMGEVYRARDTRLAREVAIKVLPAGVSADPERLRRFEREARSASALNHPNIVTIYDIGSSEGISYIAMELVEGSNVRTLLHAGALPLRKLLPLAAQLADGLARAHEAGIVHRDLKPENVMVTKDGFVKILDFGLAKLTQAGEEAATESQLSTMTRATEPGTILGTVDYMSPEQASGLPLDFRSDQFSFGSVLYEMATGKPAFKGATRPETLAAIIREEPEPIASLAPRTPASLRWIVERCLAKEPRGRYASTEDLARELATVREHLSEVSSGQAAAMLPRRGSSLLWLLVAAFAAIFAVIVTATYLRPSPRPSSAIRSSLTLPEKAILENLALSPDGKRLAFTTRASGLLWIRPLDGATAQPITVGGSAALPFWSPDSRFVAFFSDGKLKKVDATGGIIQTICDAELGLGGAWGPDGIIVFAPAPASALYRVSASGGQPVSVTKLDPSRHEISHRYPAFLPDGRRFLYMATDLVSAPDNLPNAIRVASLDGKLDKMLVQAASNAVYASGHLLYVREDTLFVRPFDLGRLETAGDPVPIARHVEMMPRFNFQFGVSERLLVFGPRLLTPSTLLWIDRSSKPGRALGEQGFFDSPRLSPDGRRVAVDVYDPVRDISDIWIYDAAAGVGTKFVVGTSAYSENPVWSPDGDRIVYSSYRKGKGAKATLFVKPINGASTKVLLESPDESWPVDWSSDGRFVSFGRFPAEGKRNEQLWVLSMAGEGKATPFATEAPTQEDSRFSPDGRWIAFASDDSGTLEVYVRPFPGPGDKWQVSSAGGGAPRWRRDGKELFYLSADNKIMAVPVRLDPAFEAGSPAALFSVRPGSSYDASADGQRFLVCSDSVEQGSPSLTLLTDWTALLKE